MQKIGCEYFSHIFKESKTMAESNPTFYEDPEDNNPFTDESSIVVNFRDESTWKAFVYPADQDEYFDVIDEVML